MSRSRQLLKETLIADLENKKPFEANYDIDCAICGDDIMKGDNFFFMGVKSKVCGNCLAEMQEVVEAL